MASSLEFVGVLLHFPKVTCTILWTPYLKGKQPLTSLPVNYVCIIFFYIHMVSILPKYSNARWHLPSSSHQSSKDFPTKMLHHSEGFWTKRRQVHMIHRYSNFTILWLWSYLFPNRYFQYLTIFVKFPQKNQVIWQVFIFKMGKYEERYRFNFRWLARWKFHRRGGKPYRGKG